MAGARAFDFVYLTIRALRWASCPGARETSYSKEAVFSYTERRFAPGRMPAAARKMRALRPHKPIGFVESSSF